MAFRTRKTESDNEAAKAPRSRSLTRDAMRRLMKNRGAVAGGIILLLFIFAAVFADFVAPYNSTEGDILDNYAAPTAAHPFGCDFMGRDVCHGSSTGLASPLRQGSSVRSPPSASA